MTIEEARALTYAQLTDKADSLTDILNKSHDDWHRKCLNDALEIIEEVASERGLEI